MALPSLLTVPRRLLPELEKNEPEAFSIGLKEFWWLEAESNHRHTDFQSVALPTELSSRLVTEKTKYTGVFLNAQLSVGKFSAKKNSGG